MNTATASSPGTDTPPPARRRRRGPRPSWFLVIPSAAVAIVALSPFWYLLTRAHEAGWDFVADEIFQARTFWLVVRSFGLCVTVTGACIMIGTAGAWLVSRTDLPGRSVAEVALALPLAVPSYVAAFAWISVIPEIAGFWGASLVLTLCTYPYVYLPVLAALRRLDPAQEEVARSLGASVGTVARSLTLRQLRPAVAGGGLLVALYALSDFGAVATMRYEVFTFVIYGAYRAGFNPGRAAVLALVLAVLAIALTAFESRARGRAHAARVGAGAARRAARLPLGRWRWPAAGGVFALVAAALVFPVVTAFAWMARGLGADVDVSDIASAAVTTAWWSLLAALFTTLAALPVGVLAARSRRPVAVGLERATYFAHALPGIVIGLSMVLIGLRVLPSWYQRVPLLVLAMVVLFVPVAVASVRSSVEQSPLVLEEVARGLGAGPWSLLRRITAPLAGPGLWAGATLVFLAAAKELPVTLLLRPTGSETLATEVWQATAISDYSDAGPFALALVLVATVPAAIHTRAMLAADRRGGAVDEDAAELAASR